MRRILVVFGFALAACGGSGGTGGGNGGGSGGGTTGGACATPCGSACCTSSQECISGACCSTPCGSACCTSGSVCVKDSAGNQACAVSCTSGSQCPAATPCCAVLQGGGGACVGNGIVTGQACICTTGAECSTGCCAPLADSSGNPTGPYVCKANDGAHYDCCVGATVNCGGNDCCVADSHGNEFCAEPCTNNSTCGSGHCDTFDFSHTTCSGPTACGT